MAMYRSLYWDEECINILLSDFETRHSSLRCIGFSRWISFKNVHTTFIPFLKFIWQLSMKVNTPKKKKKILHLLIISIIVFFIIIVVATFLLSKFNLERSVALDIHQTQPLTSFSGQNFPWHSIWRLRLSMLASMLETERQLAARPAMASARASHTRSMPQNTNLRGTPGLWFLKTTLYPGHVVRVQTEHVNSCSNTHTHQCTDNAWCFHRTVQILTTLEEHLDEQLNKEEQVYLTYKFLHI